MALFLGSYTKVIELEFNSPSNALHRNPGEEGLTFMGVYQKAYPNWEGWKYICEYINNIKQFSDVSRFCYDSITIRGLVKIFYKEEFWDKLQLEKIKNQQVADEIFVFAVNIGIKNAVKEVQKILQITPDGIVGSITVDKLNSIDANWFNEYFDKVEIAYYDSLVERNPSFKQFLTGWYNRAKAV